AVVDTLGDLATETGGSIQGVTCDANEAAPVRALVAAPASPDGRGDIAGRALAHAAACPDGRVDIAVAVPGGGTMGPVLRMEPSELERILRNNIVSAFLLLKFAGARMVQHGGGSFVGISSASGVQTTPMLASYC